MTDREMVARDEVGWYWIMIDREGQETSGHGYKTKQLATSGLHRYRWDAQRKAEKKARAHNKLCAQAEKMANKSLGSVDEFRRVRDRLVSKHLKELMRKAKP